MLSQPTSFIPNHALRAPQGAIHFGILFADAEIEFAPGASASGPQAIWREPGNNHLFDPK